VLQIASLVNGFTVFVGTQVDCEIERLSANCARYFRERVTTHKFLLWTVTSSVVEKRNAN
jgi:hypothetical protein